MDKVESVDWRAGQASGMTGCDMDDWHVALWFDHDDPIKSEKERQWHPKPEQDVYIVGPTRRKKDTASFGMEFVGFLRQAGAALEQGEDDCTFTRTTEGTNRNGETPANPSTHSDEAPADESN